MSKEGSPELTKSWVIVDNRPDEPDSQTKATSGVQEVPEPQGDSSDTDSISVISESGCSYKTDEEEVTSTEIPPDTEELLPRPETPEPDAKESEILPSLQPPESKLIEKLSYFATSAACAIILIGFSMAVQHYFHSASKVSNFDPEEFVLPRPQSLKDENVLKENPPRKLSPKRKSHFKLEELENKIAKLQEGSELHDKIRDNDLRVEGKLKSNYKLNKNKNTPAKCNKENCVVGENHEKPHGETYDKKIKELKIKEDYLREKEKFLIEKEHDLLKKEIKLNKEKQHYTKNKHDKKTYRKEDSSEDDSGEKKDKCKPKGYPKNHQTKTDKKYKHKVDKKHFHTQKRFRFSDDQNRKRNISGQWYMNLHEARDSMRQRKRASYKRNKAHWYFQWMVDRARLRVK